MYNFVACITMVILMKNIEKRMKHDHIKEDKCNDKVTVSYLK